MSVSATVTLPNAPATGVLRYTPLGGNGYTSPHAMYQLKNFLVTGDSGGGTASLEVVMDDRFCCMIAYASMIFGGASTNPATVNWTWGGGLAGISPQFIQQRQVTLSNTSVGAPRIADTFDSPAFVHGSDSNLALTVTTVNEDADTVQLFLSVYLFNINAREKVPIELLVAARGGV